MSGKKVNVKALQPFSHGNVVAATGGVYAMNAAEVPDLVKAGFVEEGGAAGDVEATQIEQPFARPAPGDVVSDEDADILGAKMDVAVENKMANAASNKRAPK